jgi:hypothetical protein
MENLHEQLIMSGLLPWKINFSPICTAANSCVPTLVIGRHLQRKKAKNAQID